MNRCNALAGRFFRLFFLLAAGLLAACGGGDDDDGDGEPVPTYSIGFTVSGSQGSVLLARNNAGDDLVFAGDGSYTFATPLVSGSPYSVTVPAYFFTPGQTCTVSDGVGTVGNANVTSVRVDCGTAPPAAGVVPRFLFVTGENRAGAAEPGLLRAYAVNAQSGALTLTDSIGVPEEPYLPLVHPSGRFVYVMPSVLGAGLSSFRIDEASGQFTRIAPDIDVGGAGAVFAGSMDPLGRFLLLGHVYPIDPVSGALTVPPPGTPRTFGGVQGIDPTGRFVYSIEGSATGIAHYSIDPVTFALTRQSAPQAAGARPQVVAIDPAARFVHVLSNGAQGAPDTISSFRADLITGALTLANPGVELGSRGATSMAMHPSGRSLLVANSAADTLSLYTVDRDSGIVSKRGADIAAGDGPLHVVFDPSGTLAYVTNAFGDTLSRYAFDAASGVLAPRGEQATQRVPIGIAISAGAVPVKVVPRVAYMAQGNQLTRFNADGVTGQLSLVDNLPMRPVASVRALDLAVHPSRRFLYVAAYDSLAPPGTAAGVLAYRIDAQTGALSPLGAGMTAAGPNVFAIAIDPSGAHLYAADPSGTLRTLLIDADTGELSALDAPPDVPIGEQVSDLRFEPSGRFLYAVGFTSNAVSAFSLDAATGELRPVGTFATPSRPSQLDFSVSGRFAYVVSTGSRSVATYRIDSATGALVSAGPELSVGPGVFSVAVHPTLPYLYAAGGSPSSFSVQTFRTDTADGIPVGAGVPPLVRSVATRFLNIDPSGRFLYLDDGFNTPNAVTTFRIDPTTGALASTGPPVVLPDYIDAVGFLWGLE